MSSPGRVLRAFITAVKLTLRGETPPVSTNAALITWMKQSARLIEAAIAAADLNGLDQDARRQRTLTAEGRRTNMDTILAAAKFHAAEEYPHLMANPTQNVLGAIYSTNLNDRFLVSKLFDSLESGDVREAVGRVVSHLEAIPPIE